MADNSTMPTSDLGGDTYRNKDRGTAKTPVSLIDVGGSGAEALIGDGANAMPVSGPLTDTELRAAAVPVLGPLTDAELRATPVPVSGPITDAELRATAVPVSLASVPSHAVTGPLTDAELRAAAVPVSGPLTDAQLRAVAVPISVATIPTHGVTGPLTDAELRATAVPVSATALPLPAGAATAANQATEVGHLATLAGGVSGTEFQVDIVGPLPAGTAAIGKLAANAGVTIGAVELAAAQTLATVTTVTTVSTVTTVTTVGTVTNLAQMGGQAIAMGTGTRSAGTQRVTIATDDVVPASQSGTWTVQPGNTPNTTAWLVSERPATSGGLTSSSFISTAAVQATAVKASAGQIYSIEFFNTGATPVFVRLYNKATTPGTGDTPIWRGTVPGDAAGAGFVKSWPGGLACSAGIGFRCTAAVADNDATALTANAVLGNVEYK